MERVINTILKNIAKENNYTFETYAHDWIVRITNGNKRLTTYGYIMQGIDSVSQMICRDKSALCEVLKRNNIPAIEHCLHLGKKKQKIYLEKEIGLDDIYEFFDKYGQLVIKDNNGGSGIDVYLIRKKEDIDKVCSTLLNKDKDIAISPYFDAEDEYRIVVYKNEPQIVFKKQRPNVVGNGKDTIEILMKEKYGKLFEVDEWIDLNYVPKTDEKVTLRWMHNLKYGANAVSLDDEEKRKQLFDLAKKVAKVVGIKFASVDIMDRNGELMVLEVNSGVTLEKFARTSEENYKKVEELYKKIVFEVLQWNWYM